MDGSVGEFIEPLSAEDPGVCRIIAFFIVKNGNYISMLFADITVPGADIPEDEISLGLCGSPLGRIAVSCHKGAGIFIEAHDMRRFFRFCFSYFHISLSNLYNLIT